MRGGNFQWARLWGGPGYDNAGSLAIDSDGHLKVSAIEDVYGSPELSLLSFDTNGTALSKEVWSTKTAPTMNWAGMVLDGTGTAVIAAAGFNSSGLWVAADLPNVTSLPDSFVTNPFSLNNPVGSVSNLTSVSAVIQNGVQDIGGGVADTLVLLVRSTLTGPTPRAWLGGSALGNAFYSIGGGTCPNCAEFGGNETGSTDFYDPSTNTWTTKHPLGTPRFALTALSFNGKIYAIGGTAGSSSLPSPAVEEFDPTLNSWSPKSSMITPRWKATGSVADGMIFAIGGGGTSNQCIPTNAVEAYDPLGDMWSVKTAMPTPRWGAASAAISSQIYVVGGSGLCPHISVDPLSTLEIYDPLGDTWTSGAPMSVARWDLAAAAVNGKLYAIGGWDPINQKVLAAVEEYDPASNTWSAKTQMPTARSGLVALAISGKIYAFGGTDNSKVLDTLEIYDPATNTWSNPQIGQGSGMISVSTNNASATFTITDGASNNFSGTGTSFSQTAPPGTYTINFGSVAGFSTPGSQTQTLSSGGTIGFDGTYDPLVLSPSNLHATVGSGSIMLDWDPSQTPSIDGYNIYIEQFIGDHFVVLGTVNAIGIPFAGTRFVVSGQFSEGVITNGNLYRFHVTAVKSGVESLPSNLVLARPGQFALSQLPPPPKVPILFLHGICLPPSQTDGAVYWKQTTDFLTNDLHWTDGGTLKYLSSEDPRELLPVTDHFVPGANFYTATFGNCSANYFVENPFTKARTYFGQPGILHQGDEVQGFIRMLSASGAAKFNIVAHSMGGLAARSYIAENPDASTKVMNFITYGSPHWGVPSVYVVSPLIDSTSDGARDLTVNCDFNPLGLTSTLDYESSSFLEHLRQIKLPDLIRYVNIRGQAFFDASHFSDLSGCLSAISDGVLLQLGPVGISLPLIPIDSADLLIPAHAPINQPVIVSKRTLIATDRTHTSQPGDFSAILCALELNCVIYRTHSPVDIEITAPDGRMITRQLTEIPGASYMETLEETGTTSAATVLIPFPLAGDYSVKVVPKPEAAATDSYGLDVTRAGISTVLAQDQSIQAISAQPYTVTVLPPLKIDIRPGNKRNVIELEDEGEITVAIVSTPEFNASERVDTTTLSFGHFGDENSLAFCDKSGKNINKDGLPNLVCHFFTKKAGFVANDVVGILKGTTKNGVPFVGTDSVSIILKDGHE